MSHHEYLCTREHEWIDVEDNIGIVGITDYAQKELGDIVTVELPEIGGEVKQHEAIAIIDSLKTTSDICAPASGRVIEVNENLLAAPELINKDPYGEGWVFKIELKDKSELSSLMTIKQYEAYIAEDKMKSTAHSQSP